LCPSDLSHEGGRPCIIQPAVTSVHHKTGGLEAPKTWRSKMAKVFSFPRKFKLPVTIADDFSKKKKKKKSSMDMFKEFRKFKEFEEWYQQKTKKEEKKEDKKENWFAKKYTIGTMLAVSMIVSIPYAIIAVILLDILRMKLGMR
jgi:hypothetical protein